MLGCVDGRNSEVYGIRCKNGNRIKAEQTCDGVDDCGDNSDEFQLLCSDGYAIFIFLQHVKCHFFVSTTVSFLAVLCFNRT